MQDVPNQKNVTFPFSFQNRPKGIPGKLCHPSEIVFTGRRLFFFYLNQFLSSEIPNDLTRDLLSELNGIYTDFSKAIDKFVAANQLHDPGIKFNPMPFINVDRLSVMEPLIFGNLTNELKAWAKKYNLFVDWFLDTVCINFYLWHRDKLVPEDQILVYVGDREVSIGKIANIIDDIQLKLHIRGDQEILDLISKDKKISDAFKKLVFQEEGFSSVFKKKDAEFLQKHYYLLLHHLVFNTPVQDIAEQYYIILDDADRIIRREANNLAKIIGFPRRIAGRPRTKEHAKFPTIKGKRGRPRKPRLE